MKYEKIAIIAAKDEEIAGLRKKMNVVRTENISGMEVYVGELAGKEIIAVKGGIGKVFAAMCTEAIIMKYSPDCIINTGIAGGIGEGISILDTVVADDTVQYDMDTSAVGDPVGLVSGINMIRFPTDKYLSDKLFEASLSAGTNCHRGTVATGDTFISKKEERDRIKSLFSGIACEMEAAAIGQVCYVNSVPYGIIRAISDNGDTDSGMDYYSFLQKAADNSLKTIFAFIENI